MGWSHCINWSHCMDWSHCMNCSHCGLEPALSRVKGACERALVPQAENGRSASLCCALADLSSIAEQAVGEAIDPSGREEQVYGMYTFTQLSSLNLEVFACYLCHGMQMHTFVLLLMSLAKQPCMVADEPRRRSVLWPKD